jgi:hypothetical protein
MPIFSNVETLSNGQTVQIADRTIDAQRVWVQNQQPANTVGEYSRAGYVYLLNSLFTITQGAHAYFSCETGATGLQIEFYEIESETSTIHAKLLDGATSVVTTGDPIPAFNLNRNFSDAHNAVFKGVTSLTGGTIVSAEVITATNQAGGQVSSAKVHTLKPNTQYVFDFENIGAQTTRVFFQMGFTEQYNGHHDVWLGTPNSTVRLRGGESVQLDVFPYETIVGSTTGTATKVATFRQD